MQNCKTVHVRERKLKHGRLSLYLEYYPGIREKDTMKVRYHEYLGIYLFATPKNKRERDFNRIMREKAEAIRCQRYQAIINERYDLVDFTAKRNDFLAYFRSVVKEKDDKWECVYRHFSIFVKDRLTYGEVDEFLCKHFRDYLLNKAWCLGNPKKRLSQNTAASYWRTFRSLLVRAYHDRVIHTNINDFLEEIKETLPVRNSLSLDELRRMAATPFEPDVAKRACVFSCMTGLRLSDVLNLKWENLRHYTDGGKYLDYICIKTGKQCYTPISEETYRIMGEPAEGSVFKIERNTLTKNMKELLKKAGITNHITFHCFRHTFASLQVELGTDIYTVQHLLAHSGVSTTEIYARHANPKSREAANRIVLNLPKEGENKAKDSSEEKGTSEGKNLSERKDTSEAEHSNG